MSSTYSAAQSIAKLKMIMLKRSEKKPTLNYFVNQTTCQSSVNTCHKQWYLHKPSVHNQQSVLQNVNHLIYYIGVKTTWENRQTYHGQRIQTIKHSPEVGHNLTDVIVGDLGAPACTDAICTVYQHHGKDGAVPLWLDALVVVIQVFQQGIVFAVDYVTS